MSGAINNPSHIQDAYRGEEIASRYIGDRFHSELNRVLHVSQVARVQRLLERIGPGRALEIAPGPGRLTRDIRPVGPLVCLEYNEGMIGQGRRSRGGQATWVRGDGLRLPLASEGFDLVYSFRFVRHFRRPDRERIYAEIRRVLRPGGYFAMDAVNARVSRPLREAAPQEFPIYDELYRLDDLRREMDEVGLPLLETESVQKFYRWQYRSQTLLGPRADWLNRWVIRGLERMPSRDGLEWIVTCRRG